MKYLLLKDQRRRIIYSFFERKRRFLQALYQDLKLTPQFRSYVYHKIYTLPRDASITRIRNRCVLTNRPRAIYRRFGISRLMFRKYAWQGRLIGVKKSSW